MPRPFRRVGPPALRRQRRVLLSPLSNGTWSGTADIRETSQIGPDQVVDVGALDSAIVGTGSFIHGRRTDLKHFRLLVHKKAPKQPVTVTTEGPASRDLVAQMHDMRLEALWLS